MSFQSLREMLQRLWRSGFADPAARGRGAGIAPGLYHFMYELAGEPTRFHLRVDSSGNGILLANASAAARLRPSGVILAKGLLEGDDDSVLFERLCRTFRDVPVEEAKQDIRRVLGVIHQLAESTGDYPMINLADPTFTPEADRLDLPLSADVPLADPERMVPLLDRMWELGIPHVTVVAGKQPDTMALVRAVERAEDLGMIAGVRASGSVLSQGTLVRDLARAGVDHLDVLYLAAAPGLHDTLVGAGDHERAVAAFRLARENEVCPVAEIALTLATAEVVDHTIRSLRGHGIGTAALFALATDAADPFPGTAMDAPLACDALIQVAATVEETADAVGVRLLWYPPVEFLPGKSLAEQACAGPRTSGDTAVRVEPDGAVIPARGPRLTGGNLLADPWPRIYQSEAFRNYRARVERDTHCDHCPGLVICSADCPRSPQGWAREAVDSHGDASRRQTSPKENGHEA
ncbi:MAG: hypothetical protein U1E05_27715 [Patescibacteria group bacterium]|nr:hypothetical protein [Patescibacteria group bacterium]